MRMSYGVRFFERAYARSTSASAPERRELVGDELRAVVRCVNSYDAGKRKPSSDLALQVLAEARADGAPLARR